MTASSLLPLKISLGLLSLWGLSFWFWKDYRLDLFREDIFELREDLFTFAARGGVSFDHPAYQMLRRRLNVLLRYAHFFTFSRFFAVGLVLQRYGVPEDREWREAVMSLPSLECREKFEKIHIHATFAVIEHIFSRSLILFLISIPLRIAGETKKLLERNSRRAEKFVDELERRAQQAEPRPSRRRGALPVGVH